MHKIVLSVLLSITTLFAVAQVQTRIIGDSIDMRSNTGKAELRLENSTDSVPGFLYNKGAGRTAFRHGLIKLSDTVYVIGADTLHLGNLSGGTNGKTIFYVSKKYTGIADAVVSGYTLSSVSSSNASYRNQLGRAVPGSMTLSYPDPFSARNAALDAIAAGSIPNAQVVVLEGNSYTIGSNDSTQNGSIDGQHPNNSTVADIQFSKASITADTAISSLMRNKVDMYFCKSASLTYINSVYAIYCFFNADTTAFKSGIYGPGSFYQVYGEVNGFVATFGYLRNRASVTDFHAHEVVIQQWKGFVFTDYDICNIEMDNLFTTDCNTFMIGDYGPQGGTPLYGNVANNPRMLNIKMKNVRYGKGQIPYPDSNDNWYFILLGDNAAMQGSIVTVDIDNFYLYASNSAPLFQCGGGPEYGVRMTVNIGNLIHRDSHITYDNIHSGLIYSWGPTIAVNNTITYNIQAADIDAPLLGMMNWSTNAANKNNHFNINVGDLVKNQSAFLGGLFKVASELSQTAGEPLLIKINGNFRSYDSAALIYAYNNWYSLPLPNRYEFSGRYETMTAGIPVAHFYVNTGKVVALTDALLINDGVTPGIMADSVCNNLYCNCCQPYSTPVPIYIRSVHANSPPGANIQQIGDMIRVAADIKSFFN